MKKDNKFEIGIVVGLVILTIILLGIYAIIEIINKRNSYTLFVFPYTVLECTKWKCEDKSVNIGEYNSNKYITYIDGEYTGINKVLYNNKNIKMYVFDDNNKNIFKDKNYLLAYKGNPTIKQYSFTINDLNDSSIISKLSDVSKMSLNQIKYIKYDFDGDSENEYLYISNSGFTASKYYNLMVYRDEDRYQVIENETVDDFTDNSLLSITNLVDIFDDNKIEFIVTKEYYDQKGYCNVLYRLKGKKFVPVNECNIIGIGNS